VFFNCYFKYTIVSLLAFLWSPPVLAQEKLSIEISSVPFAFEQAHAVAPGQVFAQKEASISPEIHDGFGSPGRLVKIGRTLDKKRLEGETAASQRGEGLLPALTEPVYVHISHAFLETKTFSLLGSALPQECPSSRGVCFVLEPDSKGFYLAVKGVVANYKIEVTPASEYRKRERREALSWFLFFGALIALASYNLALGLGSQDQKALWYGGHLVGLLGCQICLTGFAVGAFWPAAWQDRVILFFINVLMAPGFLQFGSRYLMLSQNSPFFSKSLHALTLVSFANFFFSFWLPLPFSVAIMNLVVGLGAALPLIPAVFYFKRNKDNIWFILSFFPIGLIGGATLLKNLGVFSPNPLTEFGIIFGFGLQALLLSLSLSFSVARLKRQAVELALAAEKAKKENLGARLEQMGFVAIRLADKLHTPLQTFRFCSSLLARHAEKNEGLTKIIAKIDRATDMATQEIQKLAAFREFAPKESLQMELDESIRTLEKEAL
jgi:hypothetical protein